ncbi:AMP-binding protein [Pseudomaricurvus sp. HS19]|uniref:AMP-binding protein n=1 Tax=Pseudomaricurvus sp. HS19 TaxID=2692626 RepID=UPI00137109CF|nr:AMP-binding protein [Pseudomaricurvus sp. HS19]MYM62112.1 AMP-binding protein [Pseudomaricurvus sp. HS19]
MNKNDMRSIPETVWDAFGQFRDKPAFTCMGKTLTYREMQEYSEQFASFLQHHTSLQPGDRVAVQLPNLLQYPVVMFGILRAGMILVNTNPLYTERELEHQLNDAGAKALVVFANLANTAANVIHKTSVETVVVTDIADLHGFPKRPLINGVVRYLKRMVPAYHFPSQITMRRALALGRQQAATAAEVQPEDVAVLQYTGGTTGVAKGAMLTHANIVANMHQTQERIGELNGVGVETYAAPLPLYHIYAFTIHCMMLVNTGNHSILIPNPRDLASLVSAIKPFRLTGFVGLNTLFNGLCHNNGFQALDFSKLKITASGGMALTADVAKLWEKVTGCKVTEGYGMTETSPVISANFPSNIHPGTVGPAVRDTEVRVLDEAGTVLPVGQVGELEVKGPQVMKGYWQRPDETAQVMDAEGWLKTGDMAVLDEEGYIRIVDRKKDMIIVSGFNVYPNEVEDEITQHPGVLEAAVIGVPSDKTGEAVKLFVVRRDPSLTIEDVIGFCRERMTAYKVPHLIEFRDELPKSNVGKVLRRELKDQEMRRRGK